MTRPLVVCTESHQSPLKRKVICRLGYCKAGEMVQERDHRLHVSSVIEEVFLEIGALATVKVLPSVWRIKYSTSTV